MIPRPRHPSAPLSTYSTPETTRYSEGCGTDPVHVIVYLIVDEAEKDVLPKGSTYTYLLVSDSQYYFFEHCGTPES